jgi:hypothetical protein
MQVPTHRRCESSTWDACKKENHQVGKRNTLSPELAAPSSPIASEGEESPDIESFEERVARFDEEVLMQQWYDAMSFSGFGFDYGGMVGASSSIWIPSSGPNSWWWWRRRGRWRRQWRWWVKPLEDLPNTFWCLMTKGEKYQLKLEGLAFFCLVLFCLEKLDYPILPSIISICSFCSLVQWTWELCNIWELCDMWLVITLNLHYVL